MSARATSRLALLLALVAVSCLPVRAQQAVQGTWTIEPSFSPGMVQFHVQTHEGKGRGESDSSHPVALRDLGLSSAQLNSAGQHATFALRRDAGSFACDGWLERGNGSGTFLFTPNTHYVGELQARGYTIENSRELVSAAILDVSLAYADAMANAGYSHVSFGELLGMRALGVDDAYLAQMKQAGLNIESAHEATELRALRVDPQYVREMASVGYAHLSTDELVELRSMGIDATYVRRAQAHGFAHLSVQKLIEAKAMGVI